MTCQTFTHIYLKRPLGRFQNLKKKINPPPPTNLEGHENRMMLSNHVNIYLLIGFTSTDISFC